MAAAPKVTRADVTRRTTEGRSGDAFEVRKASNLLAHAQALIAAGSTDQAVAELNKLVRMQLPATQEADKLIAESYKALGDVYRTTAAGKAIQFYTRSVAKLSPTVDSAALANTQALIAELRAAHPEIVIAQPADPAAPSDAGDDTCADAVAVTIDPPHHEVTSISPAGDHNFRKYTTSGPSIVRIETLSDDTFGDDTTLTLWGSCSGSTAGNFIQFDDDGGPGFLSLIQTACLPAGTYWVDVGGFADITEVSDADLIITNVGPCVIPAADQYEPDNELAAAKKIGYRNNGVGEGNQTGRNNNNIQHHSIYAAGDIDFLKWSLNRASLVRFETSGPNGAEPDTIIGVSLPDGTLIAVNDDQAPDNFTSRLAFCMPPGELRGVVVPFAAQDTFPYDVAVDVESRCAFEAEPNGSPANATPIQAGQTVSGLHTFAPVGDNDFFRFTLTAPQQVLISTSGYDIFDVDTTLDLFDSNGTLIATDEDGGDGFLSAINVLLPPGTYYVNVWSFFAGYYFPYDLSLTFTTPPIVESEPNDDCGSGNVVTLGDTVEAGLEPSGDIDSFHLVVPASGFVEIETQGAGGDTVINIVSADGQTFIGCDDDNGDGFFSLWGCCLPAGEYCVQVTEFDPGATLPNYTINFRNAGTCNPSEPLVCPSEGLSCP